MDLNVPNIRKTIDWITNTPEHFNMDQFRCGTTMCIGGFAATLHPDFNPLILENVEVQGQEALGLTRLQADQMFYGKDLNFAEINDRPQVAIDMLERLIETGEVQWKS